MPFELSGKAISRATAWLPKSGVWHARATLVEPATLAVGSRVTLQIGDVSMVGTVAAGGTVWGESSYRILGGAGGWEKEVAPLPYVDPLGVDFALVVGDLAAAVGETLAPISQRTIGGHWTRLGGPASSALRDLVGDDWYVGLEGATYLSARPVATAQARGEIVIESFDPVTGRIVLSAPDDGLSRFLPGALIASPDLPAAVTLSDVILRADRARVFVEAST